MRIIIVFIGLCLSLTSGAQTYTFECVSGARLSGDSCDICPNTIVESRSFNGLVIYRDSAFYRWVDQPYSIRVKPGEIVEYWEHSVNPYSERITIPLALTGFFTVQGMADSTWCNSSAPNRFQAFSLDSIDATHAAMSLSGDDTDEYLAEGVAVNFTYQGDTMTINVDTTGLGGGGGAGLDTLVAIPPAAGFTIAGSPAQNSRDTLTFALANDLAALEALADTGFVVRTGTETYSLRKLIAGTGISITNIGGVSGSPTITNTGDLSTTNEVQTYSHASAANLYTNTLSIGGGSWSIAGAGINVVTSTAGAIIVTGTEVDGSITNELQTIANTSNATSHTATLSNTGGSLQFVEGAGITLTTTGTGLDGVLTLASSITQYTDENAQDAVGNILTDGSIIDFTYNDAGNTITATVFANSIGNAQLRQGVARSVIGVTGNAGANVADIQGTADQVLRVTTAGTALSFGTVATGGIADQAVTYVKMQNAAANNVLIGNNNGANTSLEEITVAAAQTMLGYIDAIALANQQIAYGSDANTITSENAFLYDATNDRQSIICTTPALGAGAAILNLSNVGTDVSGEFFQARGNMSGNLICGQYNTNNANVAAHSFYTISSGGTAAGDAFLQLQIAGAGGNTSSFGVDNSDGDKIKLTPSATTPGGTANHGIIVTQDATTLVGVNKDAPGHPLDVAGRARSNEFIGVNTDEPTVGTLGNGLGTGGAINDVTGTNNGFAITFTVGTAPVAGGVMFTVTYHDAYPAFAIPVFSPGTDEDASNEYNKFSISANTGASFTMEVVTGQTLTAGTQYILNYAVNGF